MAICFFCENFIFLLIPFILKKKYIKILKAKYLFRYKKLRFY